MNLSSTCRFWMGVSKTRKLPVFDRRIDYGLLESAKLALTIYLRYSSRIQVSCCDFAILDVLFLDERPSGVGPVAARLCCWEQVILYRWWESKILFVSTHLWMKWRCRLDSAYDQAWSSCRSGHRRRTSWKPKGAEPWGKLYAYWWCARVPMKRIPVATRENIS